jgi:hypothetical protein
MYGWPRSTSRSRLWPGAWQWRCCGCASDSAPGCLTPPLHVGRPPASAAGQGTEAEARWRPDAACVGFSAMAAAQAANEGWCHRKVVAPIKDQLKKVPT